jgi:hypothetical protein
MDCAAGRGLEAPTVSGTTELLARGDGTPSPGAILVEADLAVRIAGRRAEGRICWAGLCLDDASTSTARPTFTGASLASGARCPAAARSTAAAWYPSSRAIARPTAAATVVTCSPAARSTAGQADAFRRAREATTGGLLVARRAPTPDA